jgi:hypothetical protein
MAGNDGIPCIAPRETIKLVICGFMVPEAVERCVGYVEESDEVQGKVVSWYVAAENEKAGGCPGAS